MRRVTVCADQGIRKRDTLLGMHNRRHALQIDLVHDAVAGRNHVNVFKGLFCPVNKMEAIFVSSIFDSTVFFKRVRIETATLDGQGVIDNQLCRHHRINECGISALRCNRIPQTCQIHQSSLPKNVMTNYPGRKPGKIQVAFAFDDLSQRSDKCRRIATPHQIFSQYTRGIRQLVIRTRFDGIDRRTGIEVIKLGTWKRFAIRSIHIVDAD